MKRGSMNAGIFAVEGLNALATAFYFNYLFFLLKSEHGFTNLGNLTVAALNGLIFVPSALYGGKLGQKRGYLNALIAGCVIMIAALAAGAWARTAGGLILAMAFWTVGMCFTWPNLEALISDRQDPKRLPAILGVYNIVWSGGAALAYFFGGAVVEAAGWRSIFWIPVVLHFAAIAGAALLKPQWREIQSQPLGQGARDLDEHHPEGACFLKMAWVANPFAYLAINTVVALIPDLAGRFDLSPKWAGVFCSIWFFSRMATFGVLAVWPGWHYRFGHLIAAYAGTAVCFALMLLGRQMWLVVGVQVAFGWCIGLIYYSSLYYSMHVGETKGEHGGFHEAALGAGIFGGPAIGAASLYFFPGRPMSSVIGVAGALAVGFGWLLAIRRKSRRR